METISCEQALQKHVHAAAAMLLFGGAHCGVCQVLRPRLEREMAQHFPQVALAYVDCAEAPRVCAQQGVFSLPVLRFYLDGKLVLERGRHVSVQEWLAQVERLLALSAGDEA